MWCLVTLIFLRLHYINLINIFRFHWHRSRYFPGCLFVFCLSHFLSVSDNRLFSTALSLQSFVEWQPRQKGNKQLSAFNWSGWNHTVFCFVLGNDTHLISTSGTCVVGAFPSPDMFTLFRVKSENSLCVHLLSSLTSSDQVGDVWWGGRVALWVVILCLLLLVWASEERFLSSYHYVPLFSFCLFFCVNL